jgi:PAS domain S-box-containing protein
LIEVSLTLSPIRDEAGKTRAASAIMRDISGRKAGEKALRQSEARLQAIMDNSPAMIFLKDIEGRYLHFNRQFAQAFHLRLEEGIGKTDAELFPREQAVAFRANDLTVLGGGIQLVFDEVAMHDDGPHTSLVSKAPLYDEAGKIYALVGIVTDITERKRLEEEVLHISEREHRRIAQDLHDGLGQQLAGISCLSNVLKKNLSDQGSPEAETAMRISKLLDSAVAQTRSLARGLHPVEPEPSGLMSALEDLAVMVTDLFKVSCEFECTQPVLIEDNTVATHLYRIAQEAVTNSLKHGRAQKIKIGLSGTPERIILAVDDDGVGFKKSVSRKKGLGLRIMKYRAGMIGGTLVIQKKTKGGTDMVCTVAKTNEQTPQNDDGQKTAKRKTTEKDIHRG